MTWRAMPNKSCFLHAVVVALHHGSVGVLGDRDRTRVRARVQGLTLVHLSAQRKRLVWDRGCILGLFWGCLGVVMGYEGLCRVYFVSESAQVELRSGRV